MALPDIQLDDRRFTELVDELKRRIPRYTPEWTDHSASDPGIVLSELFAWLGEMMLYRLNRVPEKNYLKFLELIGITLTPPSSAQAELTFKLTAKSLTKAVLIPEGTRVALAEGDDDGPVIFETDDNLYATPGELMALQSYDGARFKLLSEEQRVVGRFYHALGECPQAGSALYLGVDRAFPPGPRHRLTVHVYVDDLIEEGQGLTADPPPSPPPVVGLWEYWNGTAWRALTVIEDQTQSLTRSGVVVFEAAADHAKSRVGLLQSEEDAELFWLRFRVDQELGAGYEIPPRLEDVVLNTVGATQALTVKDELLGASNGLPNQVFRLSKTPVLPESLILEIDEGEGYERWQEVDDFAGSGSEDRHFTLDLERGDIRFGDGEQGKIPLLLLPKVGDAFLARAAGNSQEDALPNIRAVRYRWGGGARGNAGAGKITALQSSVPYVDSVTNLRPAFGGADVESVEDAKARAPEAIRSRSRAVTVADFEHLARTTPGARIRRAKALPLRHPDLVPRRPPGAGLEGADLPVPGVVTVVVVPDSLGSRPIPSAETLTQVAGWLEEHALVTTEIFAAAPRYRQVEVEARIVVVPDARSGEVQESLTQDLLDYFHPLHGGGDGEGWTFGGTVSFAEIYRRILNHRDVLRLDTESLKIFVDGELTAPCSDIELAPDELVTSERHSLFVSYA